MTAKLKKTTKQALKQTAIGLVFSAAIIALAITGSLTKKDNTSPIMAAVGGTNYDVSVDELSTLYIMSTIAESSQLSSSSVILSNYYSAKVQYTTNQYSASANKIEKPVITDVSGHSSGVIPYIVQEGDSIDSIIAASRVKGLTADLVRWSNGLKTTAISEGNTLYLPSVAGIVYVTKSGDTPESLALRYKSTAASICSANYLGENCTLQEGLRITLPGGQLPTTERPEYVAPARPTRVNLRYTSGNPYVAGQCTWFAWQWRHNNLPANYDLPANLGNARTWATYARSGFVVNNTPAYGAVFVDTAPRPYGHVGIVTKVSGSQITIIDMNGAGCRAYCVAEHVIDRSEWSHWSFIHQRIGT